MGVLQVAKIRRFVHATFFFIINNIFKDPFLKKKNIFKDQNLYIYIGKR